MTTDISHLMWRPMAKADAAPWTALVNAMEVEDRLNENYSEEDAADELDDPTLDFALGTLAAFDGDRMVGYSMALHKPLAEGLHRVWLRGGVDPAYRRRGIGTRLLRAGLESGKALHSLHHPTLALTVDTEMGEHNVGADALFRAEGMAPVRYYAHMEHPLGAAIADAVVPEGLDIEAHSLENWTEFLDIRNEAFMDHWGTSRVTVESWQRLLQDKARRPELSFLLRDRATGTAAGMIFTSYWEADTAATGVRDAYFGLIGTRQAYRGRGVASSLMTHALRAAEAQGYGRASLGVDADSPTGAHVLYEKAGFVRTETHIRYTIAL